jgi:phosphoglycolate phosphatase-like HAD superfamily hydrolase
LLCTGIVFDCDGVIFDSNHLKVLAFQKTLEEYPSKLVELFIDYHKSNAGISRYVKLRYFITDILDKPFARVEYERLLTNFGAACVDLYDTADLTPSCLQVLANLSAVVPLYIASGSDEAELEQVFEKRGLARYFRQIFGSPKNKFQCIEAAIGDLAARENIIMIGDAMADLRSAEQAGIKFVFMSAFSENSSEVRAFADKMGFPTIETLESLPDILRFNAERSYE